MTPLAASRKQRADRWPELLAAANVVFAERGYVAASLEGVAGQLGISGGSLYHYVRTKEELLYAILSDSYEKARETVHRHQTEHRTDESETLSFVRTWMQHMVTLQYSAVAAERHEYIRFLSDAHKSEIRTIRRQLSDYVASLVDTDITAGVLKVQVPGRVLSGAILTLMNTTREWMHRDQPDEWTALTDWYIELLEHGLRSASSNDTDADCSTLAASAARGQTSAETGVAYAQEHALLRAEQRGGRWNELVDTAGHVFAERTYLGASLAEIARRMEVRKASLYHYIGAKEELLFEIELRVHERALGTSTALAADSPARGDQQVASFIGAWASQITKHDSPYLPLGITDLEYLTKEHAEQIRSIRRVVRRHVEEMVVSGVNDRSFAATLNVSYAVNSLLVSLNRSPRWFHKGRGDPSLSDWNTLLFLTGLFKPRFSVVTAK